MRGKGSARRRGSREHTAFCYGRDSGRTVPSEGSPGGAAAQEDNVGLWRCRGSAGARALVKGSESSLGSLGNGGSLLWEERTTTNKGQAPRRGAAL